MSVVAGVRSWECKPSARLFFRPIAVEDESLYCRLYTDADVMRHIGVPLDAQTARRRFQRALRATHRLEFKQRVITLIERSCRATIGIFDIQRASDDPVAAEVGTMLVRQAQRQGYVPECLRALMSHAFVTETLTEIRARAAADNAPVERILTRLGFVLRAFRPAAAAAPACTSWALTRADWAVQTWAVPTGPCTGERPMKGMHT